MIYLFIAIIFAILGAVFVLTNSQILSLNLIFWKIENISLAVLILVSFFLGFILALLVATYFKIKDLIKIKTLKDEIKELKRQIAQRNLPLQ